MVADVAPVHRPLEGDDYVFTLPWSLTGWPAVSVPAGTDPATECRSAILDEPDLVKALLDLVTRTYIAYMAAWDAIATLERDYATTRALLATAAPHCPRVLA